MWPQLFTCKDSWLIRNGPCGTLIRENEKNVTYVTVTWIWSHLINSTRVNFECKKRKNLNKMKSNQYSHHHVHLQISLCLTFICTGMNVHNHSNDTRFFHALWSLCSFNHFPVARWSMPSNYTHESQRDRIMEAKVRNTLILDMHHQTVSQSIIPSSATPCRKIRAKKGNPGRWYNKMTTNYSCMRLFSIFLIAYNGLWLIIYKKFNIKRKIGTGYMGALWMISLKILP